MVDRLRFLRRALPWAVLAALIGNARAQAVLSDPTRPPVGMSTPLVEAGGETGPVLQSAKIPKKGKPVAVIGGQQVKLGEMYGESRLIKLTEHEAVLEGPAGIEHLPLTPGIEKTNIVRKSPAVRRAQSGGKP
ncbi:hypothetical protein [Propionivibrio sp.]|uniref:hypothetical protein n=1 Tax=Propionivibrio sp. TaxID=2212460 RepID=UPI0025FB0043|nr:hypothetical protein [Propionivibrio sp.]MBK7355381.1 hypothetical protein [Propionivibrio sp.]MBK8399775.1 hypothetical protein [Propionivibrio sp.]MBK8743327.1 hypothetical protein [Propionivibrio sp.]MBL0207132.1 hypothetical protein [Propionivibrio sp.]